MKRQTILGVTVLFISFGAVSVFAQKGISGTWEWKSPMDKQKRQDYISIALKPKAGKVTGTIFYNELENGDTESDGGVTPFVGMVKGDTVTIEFDSQAEEPGYTENLKYKKLKGRSPNTATLKLVAGKLVWTQTKGSFGEGIPKQFTMVRVK
jgi:hypothetical protein